MDARPAHAETPHVNASAASVTVTVKVPTAPSLPHDLPRTGADIDVLVMVALLLIVTGVVALLIARTRLENPNA
ncbi:MAG TPA: hypothetical protein VHN98_01215 [Acidimicrobiales bacterium]|nr:hypothetical protein [Acidimicrobiales bacterium]